MPAQRHAVGRAHHFRPAQQVGNLLEGAVHHGEAVRVAERLQNRLDEPERQDKAGDRGGGVQRSAHVEVYPGGQHGDQRGRGNGHPRDVIAVGGAEPVFHGVPVGPDRRYEFPVGGRGLVERLDDLNPVDIFHNGGVHALPRVLNRGVALRVILGHGHVAKQPHRERGQRQKRHAPVQPEQVGGHEQRHEQIRGQFGDEVREGHLHLFHRVHDERLELAGGGLDHAAQRHTGQLGRDVRPDAFQDGEGRAVGEHGGRRAERHAPGLPQQGYQGEEEQAFRRRRTRIQIHDHV